MSSPKRTLPTWPGLIALAIGLLLMFAGGSVLAGQAPLWIGGGCALAGAYWLWLCGWRTIAQGLFFVATLIAVGLKLFTAELDDPTDRGAAVVVKDMPSLVSVARPGDGTATRPYRYVIKPVDQDFVRVRLYRMVVSVGWIAAPLVWLIGVLTWRPLAARYNLDVPPSPYRRRRGRVTGRKRPLKRLAFFIGGYAFLVLGVLGLFLPILQGILFLVIGFLLLAQVSPRVRFLRLRLRARYPQWAARYDQWEGKAKSWLKSRFGRKTGEKNRKPTKDPAAPKASEE